MLKVGFVDHHLNNYHANKFLSLLHGELADLGARVIGAWESDPTGDDWCEKNGIPRLASPAAVAEASDAVILLAPDNIDTHLPLFRLLAEGPARPTLVDKFLAPSSAEAGELLAAAEAIGVPILSASSLRFAVELKAALAQAAGPASEAFATGMGDWGGYGVHTLSLVLGVLGTGVRRVINTGGPGAAVVALDYGDSRRGHVSVRSASNQWDALPWTFGFRVGEQYQGATVRDYDGFYANLMREAVRFFVTGKTDVSPGEMLEVVRILEAAVASQEEGGVWVAL